MLILWAKKFSITFGNGMKIEDNILITECTSYDYKEMLERKKVKSWLKSVSAFANTDGGSCFMESMMKVLLLVWKIHNLMPISLAR